MSYKIIKAHNGQDVMRVITPSGVTGYCPLSVPQEAIEGLLIKLLQRRTELRRQGLYDERAEHHARRTSEV